MTPRASLQQAISPPLQSRRDTDVRARCLQQEKDDESKHFEQLVVPLDAQRQTITVNFSGDNSNNNHSGEQPQSGAVPPRISELWDVALTILQEQFEGLEHDQIEAQVELPNLGQVSIRMVQRGDTLAFILRFSDDLAWRHCATHLSMGAQWLSRQLGRSVRITLLRETD